MNNPLSILEPKSLWNHFANLNAVPRASKKEEQVIQFVKQFGESLGLPTSVDATGNVLIKKPATAGLENRITVVLQSHLDMVHQKNADTTFNFDKQGIEMFVDGDWVKAKGTTLGADNGIGVSAIMALLEAKNIPHPAIEALFTIDEETGMTGALGLKGGLLDGRILLNLDTEDDTELTIGCAGGIDVTATGKYSALSNTSGNGYVIKVYGLTGGHSGMDIHKGRGNANKIMNRLLMGASENYSGRIISIDGGSLRNAIPRESNAELLISESDETDFLLWISEQVMEIKQEFITTDPDLQITIEGEDIKNSPMGGQFQKNLLSALEICHNGVYSMSKEIEGLVQTSNNLARVLVKNGTYTIMCLTRSSVDTEKMELADKIKKAFVNCQSDVKFSGSYPGWTPDPNSSITSLMHKLFVKRFGEEPNVNACHAGLECGILGTHYPGMEMISFGPNIRGAHSPDECVQISSVQKFWGFLLQVLEEIPAA